jgi:hypothetical protein
LFQGVGLEVTQGSCQLYLIFRLGGLQVKVPQQREKWEIKAAKRGAIKQSPRIKYPESPLGKMLKYWDDSSLLKEKRNKELSNTDVLSGSQNQS